MLRPDRARDLARRLALVVRGICEADGERAQRQVELVRRERRDQRRVEAAGEEHRERDVGAQVQPHRFRERLLERVLVRLGTPPLLLARPPVLVHEQRAGSELPRAEDPVRVPGT